MNSYIFTNKKEFDTKKAHALYNKFLHFKSLFLQNGYSIFNPNLQLFDDEHVFKEFERRIITNYDPSKLDNKTKYKIQLENASEKFRHFFANLIWLYSFPIYDTKQKTKIQEIINYLDIYANEEIINEQILSKGFASYGAMKQFKYYDICLLYFFVKQFKDNSDDPIAIIKNINLQSLMSELSNEPLKDMKSLASRHMLNFLFEPSLYDPIVNKTSKINIVKYFLKTVNEETLDEDIHKIRKEQFGFDKSLYSYMYGRQSLSKHPRVTIKSIKNKEYEEKELSFTKKSHDTNDDLIARQKTALENGENAELLVFKEVQSSLKPTARKHLLELLKEKFQEKTFDAVSQKLDELMHYSKNIDRYAPFDIITFDNNDITYIEVKSTTSNKIFFSRAEIIFAYNHLENYQIKVVKDQTIYNLEIDEIIEEVYETINKHGNWSFDSIEINLEFKKDSK